VLLLDELGEFPRPSLEALRQPLEDGMVAIARIGGRHVFPARFLLVGTMNLCPCGARGDPGAECSCSPARIAAYRQKLSRALLDRIDLVVTVPRARSQEVAGAPGEPSSAVAARVVASDRRLRERPPPIGEAAGAVLGRAVDRLGLSARGHARISRVAVTIGAIAGVNEVGPEHMAEALSYRSPSELSAAA
jgi:magnesium chelatase family protein